MPSVLCQAIFGLLLPLGPQILHLISDENNLFSVFIEYFHCCVLLAGKQPDCGHLLLVKAAIDMLPKWYINQFLYC